MQRAQLSRLNKETLIDSILTYGEDDTSQLRYKLAEISAEISQLRQDMTSPDSSINKKIASMQSQIDQQANVIKQQQQFLEEIDKRERETKLVVLGVPDEEEELEGASTDEDKIRKIWGVIGKEMRIRGLRRLGRHQTDRKRPILVQLESKDAREKVLKEAKRLKEAGTTFERIFMKRNVHPSVRNEWKRLREAEAAEKNRPENVGCVIRLDTKERKLYRDDAVIDSWSASYF